MKAIMRWQYTTLAKELRLLQGHLADSTCPCSSDGEWCVWKHINTVEGLAIETKAMESNQDLIKQLNTLAEEAKTYREHEEEFKCHPFKMDQSKRVKSDWSRKWAKVWEQLILGSCDLDVPEAKGKPAGKSMKAEKKEGKPVKCKGCSCHRGQKSLVVFSMTGCPHCGTKIAELKKAGIAFEEVNCTTQSNVAQCDRLKIKDTPTLAWKCGAADWEIIPFNTKLDRLRSYQAYNGK